MNKCYGVVFKNSEKKHYYKCSEDIELNTLVVVETSKGENLGKVVQLIESDNNDFLNIIRIANQEDIDIYMNNLKDADKAFKKCRELINEYGLDMHVVNASFNLDRSQLLFNFTADNRVDFRELAKSLAALYRTRIELRQIGARDKAKEVGGIGICGGELCCLKFLKKIDTISMNMAKNQNLTLNPAKINGSCGRLLCCLAYEDAEYLKALDKLPSVGDKINIDDKIGVIQSINVLNKKGKVLVDGERIDYEFSSKK